MSSPSWICWLLLAFATLGSRFAIRVAPDSALTQTNNTAESEIAYREEDALYMPNETIVGDSQLSPSERNRRLIPYMAFYLPAPQFPITQKYLTQKPTQYHKTGTSYHFGSIEEQLDPPGAIPIPTAYVHMRVPAAAAVSDVASSFQKQKQPQQKHFPPSAGTIYRSIAYGGQHPVPAGLPPVGDERDTSIMHVLPTALSSGPPAYGGPTKYRELNGDHVGHKSVVFQPNAVLHQQQPQAYRHRSKPSKTNLTPFTSSNTVPGHFVPIIYAPQSPTNDDNIHYSSNPEATNEPPVHKQQIVQHGEDYLLPPTTASSVRQSHHPALHRMQLLTLPPSAAAAAVEPASGIHPTSSPIYHHVVNDPLESSLLPSQPLNTFKQQSSNAADAQHRHFQPPKPDNFFDNEQYLNADNMTPQQQYVIYLQKRQRYNKIPQREHIKEELNDHQQYYKHQQSEKQQAQLFVISSTAAPVEDAGVRLIEMQHQTQSEQQQSKYPQHSPLRHSVNPHPEYTVPANHRIRPQQHQRVQYVPQLRPTTVGNELSTQQRTQTQLQRTQNRINHNPHTHIVEQHPNYASPIPNQYSDYLIEEPKQSLDEEHQQSHIDPRHRLQKLPLPTPTHVSPKPAFVIVTASPYQLEQPTRGPFVSTPKPFTKTQTKLLLQSNPQHSSRFSQSTRQPNRPHPTSAPPPYPYVTNKPPNYDTSLPPSSTTKSPTKFKSSIYNYGERIIPPVKRPAPVTHVDHYRQPLMSPTPSPSGQQQHTIPPLADSNQLPDIHSSSLAEILHKLQASNHLPQTLTPDNIDNSIKTLITILNNLKLSQTIAANPQQHHTVSESDHDYSTGSEEEQGGAQDLSEVSPVEQTKRPGPNTGRPGIDYPNYAEIPATAFDCGEQRYKGFFGDPETNCQVWHYCDLNGGKASFLCPNGTIFSQTSLTAGLSRARFVEDVLETRTTPAPRIALTCDWWFNVKCSTTSQLYVLNERLYKYILPFNPKFPEDYSGPIVDKYLALKFQEMEEQMRLKKIKAVPNISEPPTEPGQEQNFETVETTTTTTTTVTSNNQSEEPQSINSQVGEQSSERNLLLDDEVDDISQRGTVAAGYRTTQPSSTTREIELPLSFKPIVVSPTSEPDYDSSGQQSAVQTSAEYQSRSKEDAPRSSTHEHTKISVEKVELIEVKSDGSSGHLTPAMIFSNEAKKT